MTLCVVGGREREDMDVSTPGAQLRTLLRVADVVFME